MTEIAGYLIVVLSLIAGAAIGLALWRRSDSELLTMLGVLWLFLVSCLPQSL